MRNVVEFGNSASEARVVDGEDHGQGANSARERADEQQQAQPLLIRAEAVHLINDVLVTHRRVVAYSTQRKGSYKLSSGGALAAVESKYESVKGSVRTFETK